MKKLLDHNGEIKLVGMRGTAAAHISTLINKRIANVSPNVIRQIRANIYNKVRAPVDRQTSFIGVEVEKAYSKHFHKIKSDGISKN